jgi:hypothetical protein
MDVGIILLLNLIKVVGNIAPNMKKHHRLSPATR